METKTDLSAAGPESSSDGKRGGLRGTALRRGTVAATLLTAGMLGTAFTAAASTGGGASDPAKGAAVVSESTVSQSAAVEKAAEASVKSALPDGVKLVDSGVAVKEAPATEKEAGPAVEKAAPVVDKLSPVGKLTEADAPGPAGKEAVVSSLKVALTQ